jgi:hypothetical protein
MLERIIFTIELRERGVKVLEGRASGQCREGKGREKAEDLYFGLLQSNLVLVLSQVTLRAL